MLGYCLHGLCTLPNMLINAKIIRKSGKKGEPSCDFLVIFLLIAILGNAHRPCKQYTSIVDNDLHLSLHFS